jgi:hypothetical protein
MKNLMLKTGDLFSRKLAGTTCALFCTAMLTILAVAVTSPIQVASAQTTGTPTPGPGHQECTVCHNPQHHPITLTIDCNALKAHLAHGDYEGPCRNTPTPKPTRTPKPTPSPRHSPTPKRTPTPKPAKCEVCHNPHNPHTIRIPCDQVDKFLKNHPGDYRGPCHVTTATNR